MGLEKSIFRSAVTGDDGTIDPGYLSLYWIMAVVITAIPFMCVFAMVAMWLDPAHKFAVQDLGIGIGSVCTGFGVAVGAVGAFRAGDKPHAAAAGTVTTKTATVTTTQPEATVAAPLPVEIVAPDPLPTREVPTRKKGK